MYKLLLTILLFIGSASAASSDNRLMDELNTLNSESLQKAQQLKLNAQAGDINAQLKLAQTYMAAIAGTHISKTAFLREKAWHWYNKAMNQQTDKKASMTAEKELSYSYYLEEREDKLREMVQGRYPEGFYQLGLLLLKKDHNSSEGIQKLEAVGKQQHSKAAEKLADQYSNTFVKHYDVKKSYHWHKEAAKKGDPRYIYELARMYHYGFGDKWPEFKKDVKKANRRYVEAATYGNTDAQIYILPLSIRAKDYKNAHVLADALIKKNRAEGYFYKAEMLFQGQGLAKDKDKAIKLMKIAKTKNYHPANTALDTMQSMR